MAGWGKGGEREKDGKKEGEKDSRPSPGSALDLQVPRSPASRAFLPFPSPSYSPSILLSFLLPASRRLPPAACCLLTSYAPGPGFPAILLV
jgi:hypothetical protein